MQGQGPQNENNYQRQNTQQQYGQQQYGQQQYGQQQYGQQQYGQQQYGQQRGQQPQHVQKPAKRGHGPQLFLLGGIMLVIVLLIVGYFTIHVWSDVGCAPDAHCLICGVHREREEHDFLPADCLSAPLCKECGQERGEPLGHSWEAAECGSYRICKLCGVDGERQEHEYLPADCVNPQLCKICGLEQGKPMGHSWGEAECGEYSACEVCGTTTDKPKEHSWVSATEHTPKTCSICGKTEGASLGVLLTDCAVVDSTEANPNSPVDIKVGPWQGCFGEWYENAVRFWVRSSPGYTSGEEISYFVDGDFDTLSGTIALSGETDKYGGVQICIYGDGILLYRSAYLTKSMGFEDFSVNISGVKVIRVCCETSETVSSFGILSAKLFAK